MAAATHKQLAETVRAYFSPAYEDRHYYLQDPKLEEAARSVEAAIKTAGPEAEPTRALIREINFYLKDRRQTWASRKERLLNAARKALVVG